MSNFLLTAVGLIVMLATLVMFHELGHFTVAKLFGIKVDEFAFGFGPKWIRLFKRGDTEYTIHPIPLGGFVKLAGEEPGQEDLQSGFMSKPWWMRYIVFLSGPVASLALAYIIFSMLGFTVGLPSPINRISMVEPGSRAAQAGLMKGDLVVKINDERIDSGEEMINVIHSSVNKPLVLTIDRNGRLVQIHATPGPGALGPKVGLIGIAPDQKMVRIGVGESIRFGTTASTKFLTTTVKVLFSRDVKNNVGGPLSILAATQASVERGVGYYLQLVAILSLSLGVVNLLPIPVMDGGQMMLLLVEGIKGKRLSQKTLEVTQRIGLAAIAALFIAIMYLDLSKLVAGKLFQ